MPFISSAVERLLSKNSECDDERYKRTQNLIEQFEHNNLPVSSRYREMEEALLTEKRKSSELEKSFKSMKKTLGAAALTATFVLTAFLGTTNVYSPENIVQGLTSATQSIQEFVQPSQLNQIKEERDVLLKEKEEMNEFLKNSSKKLMESWDKDRETLRSSLPDTFLDSLETRFASLPDSAVSLSPENFVASLNTGTVSDTAPFQFNPDAPRNAVYLEADLNKAEELFKTKTPETMTDGEIALLKKLYKENPSELNEIVQQVFSSDKTSSAIIQEGEDIYTQAERKGFFVNRNVNEEKLTEKDIQEVVNYKRTTNEERFGSSFSGKSSTTVNGIELYGDFKPVNLNSIQDTRTAALLLESRLNEINAILNENKGKISLKENGQIDLSSIATINFKDVKDKNEVLKLIAEYQQIFEKNLKGEYRPSTINLNDFSGIAVNIDTAKAKNNAEVQLVHWLTFPELSKESRTLLLGNGEAPTPEIENARRSIETLVALARGTNNTKDLSKEEQKEQQARQADVITWHMQEIGKAFPEIKQPDMFKVSVTTQYEMPQAEDIAVGLQTPELAQKYNEEIPSFYSEEWLKNNRSILKYLGQEKGMEKVLLGLEKYDQALADYTSGNAYFEPTFKEAAASMRLLHDAGLTVEAVEAYKILFETELKKSKCAFLTGENSSPLNDIAIGRDASQVDILQKNEKFKPLNAHVVSSIIGAALDSLGFEPTEERKELLKLTVQIETTGARHDYQQGGAALGVTQFEPLTIQDMLGRALKTEKYLPHMAAILTSMNGQIDTDDFQKQLRANASSNMTLNTQMAVMHYDLRKGLNQNQLQTLEGRATRYKSDHNTYLGRATVQGAVEAGKYFEQREKTDSIMFTSLVGKISNGDFLMREAQSLSAERVPVIQPVSDVKDQANLLVKTSQKM